MANLQLLLLFTLHWRHFFALLEHMRQMISWPQGSSLTVAGSSHSIQTGPSEHVGELSDSMQFFSAWSALAAAMWLEAIKSLSVCTVLKVGPVDFWWIWSHGGTSGSPRILSERLSDESRWCGPCSSLDFTEFETVFSDFSSSTFFRLPWNWLSLHVVIVVSWQCSWLLLINFCFL